MSPNPVFWYLFFKFSWGGMPPDPLALACFACWMCFAHLHHQKGPLFLEKNLPTLSSVYGPVCLKCFDHKWFHFNHSECEPIIATCFLNFYVDPYFPFIFKNISPESMLTNLRRGLVLRTDRDSYSAL